MFNVFEYMFWGNKHNWRQREKNKTRHMRITIWVLMHSWPNISFWIILPCITCLCKQITNIFISSDITSSKRICSGLKQVVSTIVIVFKSIFAKCCIHSAKSQYELILPVSINATKRKTSVFHFIFKDFWCLDFFMQENIYIFFNLGH